MTYSQPFEELWQIRPKRIGGDPKPLAFKQYKARLKHVSHTDLKEGYLRYVNFCDKTGKTGTEFVMRAATFFSVNNEAWLETWEPPKTSETTEQKGNRLGLTAYVGESWEAFERRINQTR